MGEGYLSTSTTLVRDEVFSSSNSNNLVSFSAGTADVFCTIPAAEVSDRSKMAAMNYKLMPSF